MRTKTLPRLTAAVLPPVLIRYPRAFGRTRTLTLLSRNLAPVADTVCDCGGLLAFVAGRWQHIDQCLSCRTENRPCAGQHIACTDPSPRRCLHRLCNQPVSLEDRCGLDRSVHECCGCCSRPDDQIII
jgi:hypothetical protein